MRKKEGSTNQTKNGNNNHSQGRVKRVAGDVEWYKLLNENNGYKIMEGEQSKWHTQG